MGNSIEEDMKSINKGLYELEDSYELHQARWAKRIFENIKEKLDHILSDYKRVLKENEELLQEKINNQKIIASAQNDMLNYQAGFEDGKNGRTSAVQSIIENQQYYIFQKQIEKYEGHIEKLQKENEELKADNYELNNRITDLLENIPVQKVKDKISERQFELQQEYKDFEDDAILTVLQELIEGR